MAIKRLPYFCRQLGQRSHRLSSELSVPQQVQLIPDGASGDGQAHRQVQRLRFCVIEGPKRLSERFEVNEQQVHWKPAGEGHEEQLERSGAGK